MSRKLKYKSITPFHDRLYETIGSDIPGWSKKIGVTPATVRDKWFKGSYPGADKIIKICNVTGKSANWLLHGSTDNVILAQDWTIDIIEACEIVHKIMTSDNKIAKDALHTNLVAFEDHESLRNDRKRMDNMEMEIIFLKELYNAKIKSDT